MKKVLVFLMVAAFCLSLFACASAEDAPAPEPSPSPEPEPLSLADAELSGEWQGHWEMFSRSGDWADMKKYRWDCWASIDEADVLLLWDEDIDRESGLARLELKRGEGCGEVTGGWFMDNDSGYEQWRLWLEEDEQGPLLTLRGAYQSDAGGDFSFVFYLRRQDKSN